MKPIRRLHFPLRKIALTVLLAALTGACSEDTLNNAADSRSQTVRFQVEVTRRGTRSDNPAAGRGVNSPSGAYTLREGESPLYIVPFEREGIPPRETLATRSSLTDGETIGGFGVFASIKPSDNTSLSELSPDYMWNVEVTRENGWAPTDRYLWPGRGTLHFNAYSPYASAPSDGEGVTSLPLSTDKGELSINFQTPGKVENQIDLLLADPADVGSSPCDLIFNHALTAIRFAVGPEMTPCTVKSVGLRNVYSKGTLNMETGEWSALGELSDYNVACGVTLTGNGEDGYALPETPLTSDDCTFLLIPQTLGKDACISVVLEESGMETLLEAPLDGAVWTGGKTVTYYLSANPRLGSFILDVTDNSGRSISALTTDYTGGSLDFKVKSVYGNPADTAMQRYLPWKAEFVDAQGNSVPRPEWISGVALNGTGSKDMTLATSRQIPVFEGVSAESELLRQASDINATSGYRPFNLSNPTGQAAVKNTANCYLIHAPGFYSIPLVYGNGIEDGKTNTSAYKSTNTSNIHVLKNLVNHLGNAITDPYIYNNSGCVPEDAVLIWEGRLNLLQKVQLSPDKKRLIFVVSPDDICQGNAIVAVRDAAGVILWSWHIWVTPYDPETDVVTLDYHSRKYSMMTRNLGQVSAGDRVNFKERTAYLRFTQIPDDDSEPIAVTIPVRQTGKIISTPAAYNYYQWGRKDPMISDVAEWYTSTPGEVTSLWTKDFATDRTPGLSIISDYIRTPGYFWVSPHSPEVFPYYNLWNTNYSTSDEVKTVYDPSPPGYMVSRNALSALQNASATAVSGEWGKGVKVVSGSADKELFFPTQGYRSSIDGSIVGRDSGAEIGSVWTSRTTSTTDATVLVIDISSDAIQVQGLEVRADGFGVRPSREH